MNLCAKKIDKKQTAGRAQVIHTLDVRDEEWELKLQISFTHPATAFLSHKTKHLRSTFRWGILFQRNSPRAS